MRKLMVSAAAVGLSVTLAAPVMAQNYPAQNYPAQNYPSQNYPGQTYSGQNNQNQNYGNQQQYDSYGSQRDRNRDQSSRRQGQGRGNESAAALNLDVESALQARGYNIGTADGTIDAQSRAGIRAYQRDAGLDPNGQVSTQLLSHIETNNLRAGGAAAGQTDLGSAAGQALQQFLNKR